MSKALGITSKKEEDFSEWYSQIISKSELADYSSVSGCMVIRPYAYEMWDIIKKESEKRLKELGVENSYFPLLIPESLLKKEQEHVEGFSPEVAWVTQAGSTKLKERLAIRPTSEAIMYDSYQKWIRSYRDLPLKLMQWNSVLRWEFKHPVPFLRTREFLWVEGHTAFETREEADKEIKDVLKIWKDICENYLALPGIIGKKTEKEKFAGAVATYTLEYLLPNGKAAQGPDAHYDGQNFAKAYGINFLDKNKEMKLPYQNTWAISTRMLGIMYATHSDDKGLVLPPKIAPIKAVIIPIIFKENKEKVLKEAHKIKSMIKDSIIDDRDGYTPGFKFNQWELKGIPIRIEIGPKDIIKKECVVVRRDTNKKEKIKISQLKKQIPKLLDEIQDNLFKKAKKFLKDSIIEVKTWKEFEKALEDRKLIKAFSCGSKECEELIKDETGAKALNIPFEQPKKLGPCIKCNKKAKYQVYFAKSY